MSGWATEMLISTGLLIAAVLLLRNPVARLFGARAAYALWLAPALRLVLPPIPAAPAVLPAGLGSSAADFLILTTPAAGASSLPWGLLLTATWLGGAAVFLAVHWLRHHAFISDALAHGRVLEVDGVPYDVVASTKIEGPMATGLVHPLILVPDDFGVRFTPEQQAFALLHEQLHHRRGDIWASAAALVLAALHWFNPLAHLALGAFRRDMEAACDSSVLDAAGPAAAPEYALTILRCAARPAPRSLCALTSIDELKGRLAMMNLNHGRFRRAGGLILAVALAASGAATAGVAQEAAKDEVQKIEKKIVIRHVDGKQGGKIGDLREHGRLAANCPGEKFEVESGGGSEAKKEQVKFVLCSGKGEPLLTALEKAEADIQKHDDMPAERKAEILAKIRAKISELRAKG